MLPDSMRIHSRKCNARTPKKPSKKRLRERRKNPPVKNYQSEQPAYMMRKKKQNQQPKKQHAPKYNSQRNTSNGYSNQYANKMGGSKRSAAKYESNQRKKSGRAEGDSRHKRGSSRKMQSKQNKMNQRNGGAKKYPTYDEFGYGKKEEEFNQQYGSSRNGKPKMSIQKPPQPDPYLEMEGPPPNIKMSQCRICGRTFAADRIAKHQKACVKASKKPKKIKRFHKKISKKEKEKIKKSKPIPKWKQQHKEFIKQMKYMKKLKEVEEAGGDIRMLAPPPASENPDLVPCKFCGRKFREAAHERHENICQKVFGGKKGPAKPKSSSRNVKKGKPSRGRRKY